MARIAVITRYFPSSGEPTAGRSLYNTLRLVAREHVVQVFYPNSQYPSILRPRNRGYDRLDPEFHVPGVSVMYLDFPALPLISRPFNAGLIARKVLPHVRAFSPDLVFGCFLYPFGYAAMKVGRSLGVPVVARSMGSDLNRIGDFISARCTRTVLREADAVVTVSSALRRKAISMGANPETVRTIVNGCDLDAFVPKDQRDARGVLGIDPAAEVVLYIGRMDRKKGLLELVEASADVHRSRPELQVVMLGGNGPDEELVNSAVRKRDASSYIRTVPECAPDKVATWIAAADLVILPSYMEGCPNVILEALACGRPVVATNVGGIPEILNTSCGRLVRARDAAALADAMIQVLNLTWDPEWIRAHASRGWSAVAAEHLELFERLLNREEAFTQHEQLDAADAYRH